MKRRVVAAMVFLVLAKLISVTMPFMYKQAVDALTGKSPDAATMLGLGAVGLTIAYGLARFGSVAFGELRDIVFVKVGQRALRKLALETFTHIHRLSLRYHITRKTGGLSRIIERGVKGVDFLLRFMLFSIGPLILELQPGFDHLRGLFRLAVYGGGGDHHRDLCHLHLQGHRMAGQAAPADERSGHRCQPEGDRQSAEL